MYSVPEWFFLLSVGLFGLLFGSFANVLVWRFPRGESVVSPGSHCPACDHAIRWHDNVPVLSWLALTGRCRDCGERIAVRYPLVELLSGLLWLTAALRFGFSLRTVVCVAFFYILMVLTFIDLDTYRLPNALVGALAVIGLIGAVVSQVTGIEAIPLLSVSGGGLLGQPLVTSALGALLGAGLSGGIAALYGRLRGRTGLGMGDVKLLGAMGVFLGPFVLMALFVGSLLGAISGLLDAFRRGESAATHRVPFGPYLALGGVASVLVGPAAWVWYLSLLGAA
ncbi:MAG: prepilin peptidase [Coriobacteriia bacterium]|nr:prepilin peptidase [Coriobacteriia bacterium]